MKILNNIQILRGFAALNVLVFHLLGYTFAHIEFKGVLFNFLREWGANGVDLFFVISGFIMVYVQNFKQRNTKMFLLDRIVRIVPTYWVLIILLAIASFISPTSFNTVIFDIKHIILSMFFISQPIYNELPFVMVGWTIEYEFLFYVVFGLSLFFKIRKNYIWFTIIVILLIAITFNVYIILEFLYGMIIGLIFLKYDLSKFGIYFFLAGLTLLFATIGLKGDFVLQYREIIWGLPSFLCVLGAVYMRQINNKMLKLLGDASYSIYLTHYLLIPIFYKLFANISFATSSKPLLNDVLTLIIIFLIVVTAYIYFRLIERPITKYLKERYL